MKRELFWFIEDGVSYRFASNDVSYTHLGNVYTKETISRSEIESTKELNKSSIDVKFPITHTLARRWMTDRVESVITLTIFEIDEDDDVYTSFKGRFTSIKPVNAEIVCTFETIFTSLHRTGLRARFTRQCRHSLYGRGCNLNKEGFAKPGTATSITGSVVQVTGASSYDDGYFTTGILRAPDGTMRFIISHIGDTITLIRPMRSLALALEAGSQPVTLYPGCDRTRPTCIERFNNLPNNGGFEWIPIINPLGGSSIV